jgi:hypothetical protein
VKAIRLAPGEISGLNPDKVHGHHRQAGDPSRRAVPCLGYIIVADTKSA